MRGELDWQPELFSYIDLASRIPSSHLIRKIRDIVDEGLRSEVLLVDRIDYDLLFWWFVGLGGDDKVWNHSVFSKNRDRLIDYGVDELLFEAIKSPPYAAKLLFRDHFSIYGTLIEACASMKSCKPKDGSGGDDDGEILHCQKRSNDAHASTSDADARLYRKSSGKEAKLRYMGHILTENCNELNVGATLTEAYTREEWTTAIELLAEQSVRPGQTVGANRGYDVSNFVDPCRELGLTPHVAMRKHGRIDQRTAGHAGYTISQTKRKCVEKMSIGCFD